MAKLENLLDDFERSGEQTLPGEQAFDLYATYGLPLEITRISPVSRVWMWMKPVFEKRWKNTAWLPARAKPLARWAAKTSKSTATLADLQAAGQDWPKRCSYDPYDGWR